MEELTAAFCGGFQVTIEPNSTASPHPRFSMYKMKSEVSNQEKRRNEILKLQKEKRYDVMKHVRCLTEDLWEDMEEFEEEEEQEKDEAMEVEVCLRRPGRHYKNQLMFSEWMLEVPENFADHWLMVPCPVGRRNLIVASKGYTKAYAKNGRLLCTFQSALPGGNRHQWKPDTTILDCIYDGTSQTYFVLDMMCWKKTPIYDSETEFRFYWLETKFAEELNTGVTSSSYQSKYRFEPLRRFPCDLENIRSVMNQPFNIELDGILFYHKKAHYTFGSTPLVVWLKAYMLPEILDVPVPNHFLAQTPSTYGSFKQHSEAVRQHQRNETKKQAKKERKKDSQVTDCSRTALFDSEVSENPSSRQNEAMNIDSSVSDAKPNCDVCQTRS